MKAKAPTRADKAAIARRQALHDHLCASRPPFDPNSLARSYGVPVADVNKLISQHGGV